MIEFQDVTKYYGDLCALDHINLSIEKGQILGLLGPNGAGKTTSMRILTGYLNPTYGNITAKGLSIDKDLLKIKKMIGYLPESAPLYENMIVFDYLDYVAGMRGIEHGERIANIRKLSRICGLREVMHRPVHELSKGYKQRVGLAHAMMGDPEILVLDEPTTGLDPNQIVEIRDIIKKIGKEKTVILSTHILSEVEASCDRVVIIHKGRIVADGSTDELRESTESQYSVNLILKEISAENLRKEMGNIEEVSEVKINGRGGGQTSASITCRTEKDIREKIYNIIKKNDWVLLEMTRDVKSLETIFGELTKENMEI